MSAIEMALNANPNPSDPTKQTYVVVNGNSTPEIMEDTAFPLRANDGSGNRQAIAFAWQQGTGMNGGREYVVRQGDYAGAVSASRVDAVALQMNTIRDPRIGPVTGAIAGEPSNTQINGVLSQYGVRRLTPTECERLQGFEDGWTAWGLDEKGNRVEMSDAARYRMCGNAVTRNVAEWLGRRIIEVEGTIDVD